MPDAEELEDGTLDGFLGELERVDPMPGDFDPQKSPAKFHEKYAAFLEPSNEEKRLNHKSRRAFFAVAAAALGAEMVLGYLRGAACGAFSLAAPAGTPGEGRSGTDLRFSSGG